MVVMVVVGNGTDGGQCKFSRQPCPFWLGICDKVSGLKTQYLRDRSDWSAHQGLIIYETQNLIVHTLILVP